ncbi:MAG: 4Fe-4S dicluster domain-containing protein, partial [Desulfobacteraceae bacterium]|nr:4Fe-4S dicluster domain-containing protein [Desulfobacteraceae bacterium]
MLSNRPVTPSTLSIKDLPRQISWDKDKCTLCGRCTAVCPVHAIELGLFRKRMLAPAVNIQDKPDSRLELYYGIRQKTDPAYACVGCAMCSLVCPNDAVMPCKGDESDKLKF